MCNWLCLDVRGWSRKKVEWSVRNIDGKRGLFFSFFSEDYRFDINPETG